MRSALATRGSRRRPRAPARPTPALPRASGVQGLHRVDHANLGSLVLERRQHGVKVGLGDHRDRQRRATAQTLGAQPDLGGRLLGRDIQRPRPAATRLASAIVGQRRLADPGRAADQHERPGHDAAPEDVVELADAGARGARGRPRRRRPGRPA